MIEGDESSAVPDPEDLHVFEDLQELETLDPPDWEGFRTLAHRALDRMIDLHRDVRDQPVWRAVPEEVERRYLEGAPREGMGTADALRDFEEMVLPYPTGNLHPRYWGWAVGSGSPMGTLSEALAAGLNPVAGVFNDAASRVEAQLLRWMRAAMGFPEGGGGVLTSGGSVANLMAIIAARDAKVGSGSLVRGPELVVYASREVHSSLTKAVRIVGMGTKGLRLLPVDRAFRMRVAELLAAVRDDRKAGRVPLAVVGTAGTINTGAIDDLPSLAEIARGEGLWFHVDGAFGAMAALSPETWGLVAGMEEADSLAFDFHKWLHAPYEAGCILVRDPQTLRTSFTAGADYLRPMERGPAHQPDSTNLRSPQLSRGFKALKVWMTLKEQGFDKFGRLVVQNVRLARFLGSLVDASPHFERVAPVALNVVAFRHQPPGLPREEADAVNRELLMRLQERGLAVPSATLVDGRFTLRACVCNHRSRASDFTAFVEAAESILGEVRADRGLDP